MHEPFLLAALDQARLGQGHCAPNPSVGAVAVQNGKIIAQACHRGAGTPHAEHLLLAQFPPQTPGVGLYITLEPCNHWGRTPPCVEAIINHGIEEVIFSYLDPNPLVVKNHSSINLQKRGIKVVHVLLPEIDEFYKSYTHWMLTKKPRVTVKMAHSLDGKIAGPNGERLHLSNNLCNEFTQKMRSTTDVILTSARTVALDNPKMNARVNAHIQSKQVAIIDSDLSLDHDSQIFSTASHCHIFHRKDSTPNYPNSTFYSMPEKNGKIDLAAVMKRLGELGYHDVWVEAGGNLFSALHQEQLVHRTYLYIVPTSLGQNAISAYQQVGVFDRKHTVSWLAMGNNMIACMDWQEDECLLD